MLNLSLNELKLVAKSRGIKGYKSMSKERLSVPSESELVESEKNFDDERLKKIRKDFNELRHRFLKPKIREIRKNLYEIESKKNLSRSKIKKRLKNSFWVKKKSFQVKKYYDYDNIEGKRIRNVGNLFDQSTDEDYYKPIKTTSSFDNNYIEYESKGDKDKKSPKNYLNKTRPNNMINDHKSHGKLRVHSGNKVMEYKTQSEWKIQLTMSINFMSSNKQYK